MKRLLYSLFLLLSISAISPAFSADLEIGKDWGLTSPVGYNTASKNLEVNYNDYERKQALVFPLMESVLGCHMTQIVHDGPFDTQIFFTGEYKCLGASNLFNSETYRLYMGPIYLIVIFFTAIFAGLAIRIPLMAIFEAMISVGQPESQKRKQKRGETVGHFVLIGFVILCLIPIYKSDPEAENEDTNMLMVAGFTAIAWGLQAGNFNLQALLSKQSVEQPFVSIPVPKNQRTREFLNLIDFQMCVNQQPGKSQQNLTFNRYEGHVTAFAQVGSCILSIDHEIDEGTILAASANGLPDLYQLEIEALTDAYTVALTDAANIASKLSNHLDLPSGIIASEFDKTMSCEAIKTYDLGRTDATGMQAYVYASASCMAETFIQRITRAPGVTEQSLVDAKDRWFQLCQTNTDMANLEATQRACAEKMCASDSSPYMCSAQINNYARLLGSRYVTNPSYMTLIGWFVQSQYASSNFDKPGKLLANSTKIDSYQSNILEQPVIQGKPAFTVPYTKNVTTQERRWTTAAIMGAFQAEASMNLDFFGLLDRYFTIGNDGPFGIFRTIECISYPSQKSPSGRMCASVFKELDMLGNRLTAASAEIRIGTKALSIMYTNPADRAKTKAGVEMAQASMKASAKMFGGNDAMVVFATAATANAEASDIFSEYGQGFGPEASYMIAAVYANDDVAAFADSAATYMWIMGMYLKFSIPIAFAMIVISFFLGMWTKITATGIASIPHFILTMGKSKNAVDPETDTWKPIESIVVYVSSWSMFGAVTFLGVEFINTLFMFQAIPFSAYSNTYIASANASTIANAVDTILMLCLYLVFVSFMIAAILKFGAYHLTDIMRTWIYGDHSKAPAYEKDVEVNASKDA
ncbi:hypothetical protein [Pseudomonas syringae]|uniref:hypothetical protein n=1 Tax=Pseudomonas syringae TaxID=317 RepID=UPI001F1DEDA8|nr:hypothetical protein [Pseudomonas syringae]MBL3827761.1 hypothetical protein [Pseudomonas syringae pv. theae]MBL3837185.1 hypothetical protein [Pseudomonas syringae pv. theae]GKQ45051.1 hypothetical protein PSTH2693_07865 [Pseudomonas syringae pv. theae]